MSPTPDKPRQARVVASSVWWLALVSGVAVIGATGFLFGQRSAQGASQTAPQDAPRVILVERVVETERVMPAPRYIECEVEREAIEPAKAAPAAPQLPVTRVVYVDLPVVIEKEVVREVVKEVIVEREVQAALPANLAPKDTLAPIAGDVPTPLPAWMKVGAVAYWYLPDGTHRSGKITALNSDWVVVLWPTGKAEYSVDFARTHFERNGRVRRITFTAPAAVAEEEVKRRGLSANDAAQQDKLNNAWNNRR